MKTKKPKVKYTFKKRRDVRFITLSSLRKKIHIHQLRHRLLKQKGLTIEEYLRSKNRHEQKGKVQLEIDYDLDIGNITKNLDD
jgi:hypothetical protein